LILHPCDFNACAIAATIIARGFSWGEDWPAQSQNGVGVGAGDGDGDGDASFSVNLLLDSNMSNFNFGRSSKEEDTIHT
jgi:hypothetical protein